MNACWDRDFYRQEDDIPVFDDEPTEIAVSNRTLLCVVVGAFICYALSSRIFL